MTLAIPRTSGPAPGVDGRLRERLLLALPAAVIATDGRGFVVYWNDMATELFGHPADVARGAHLDELDLGWTGAQIGDALRDEPSGTGRWGGDRDVRCADGTTRPVHVAIERIDDGTGFHGFVATAADISERRALELALAREASTDSLTGLPNLRSLIGHAEAALDADGAEGRSSALVVLDLDDFSECNAGLGHDVGDEVLRTIAGVLAAVCAEGDVVARTAGDAFAIWLPDAAAALEAGEVVRRAVSAPFTVRGHHVELTASIGVAVSQPGSRAEGLLRNAELALYLAKESGKAQVMLFDDESQRRARMRRSLAVDLALALDAGDVRTHFQPQFSLVTGELVGFEALARWEDACRGTVSPDEFVPVAERTGLIDRLGRLVLRESCAAIARWKELHPARDLQVAVNVSAQQLSDPTFAASVRDAIQVSGVAPASVCLEVTESALIDADAAVAALRALRAVGVELAIDDFGTGYSSLSRLHQFPIDYLKIDRAFVTDMASGQGAAIVASVIGLAATLGIRTVAEGIEHAEQLEQLRALGCSAGQGHLWSAAVPFDDATQLLVEHDRASEPLRHVPGAHGVQLYVDDVALVAAIAGEVIAAVDGGRAVLIVAAGSHRYLIAAELSRQGAHADLSGVRMLDAEASLAAVMVDGAPDANRFRSTIGAEVEELSAGGRAVWIYGEMVGLLWDAGEFRAAMQLEDLWNDLGRHGTCSLLCGYRVDGPAERVAIAGLCDRHSYVVAPGHLRTVPQAVPAPAAAGRRDPVERRAAPRPDPLGTSPLGRLGLLTPREVALLALVVEEGPSRRELAAVLGLSPAGVANASQRVRRKLGVGHGANLADFVRRDPALAGALRSLHAGAEDGGRG